MLNSDVDNAMRASIKRHEGLRKKLYPDEFGNITGGWGHNFSAQELTDEQCAMFFEYDVNVAMNDAARFFPYWTSLDDVRKSVLIEMCFNMGIEKLLQFHDMITAISKNDYVTAAHAMLDSLWAKQVGQRAQDMAYTMEFGRYANTERNG